jgi:hypothetical protein
VLQPAAADHHDPAHFRGGARLASEAGMGTRPDLEKTLPDMKVYRIDDDTTEDDAEAATQQKPLPGSFDAKESVRSTRPLYARLAADPPASVEEIPSSRRDEPVAWTARLLKTLGF